MIEAHRCIDQDALAAAFARRYAADPHRGYGETAHGILQAIGGGMPWREAAGHAFDGQGSMGNGAAMRVAPLGAYFADDLARVVEEARSSAAPTHAHADGKAGAIAVAVGAALAVRRGAAALSPLEWLRAILEHTAEGPTHDGIAKAVDLPLSCDVRTAVAALGNGSLVIAADTVPFSLWCAARHMDDYEEALWTTVSALGDRDTTCAIVGGILALATGRLPDGWLAAREALP